MKIFLYWKFNKLEAKVLFAFCYKTNGLKSRNTPDESDFGQKTKCSIPTFRVFMTISDLLHLLHLHHYINHWFIHLLYILHDECIEDLREEYSSAKRKMRNQDTLNKLLVLKWCIFNKLFVLKWCIFNKLLVLKWCIFNKFSYITLDRRFLQKKQWKGNVWRHRIELEYSIEFQLFCFILQ